jgi:hypothetical protein
VRQMSGVGPKLAAAVMLVALGGIAGFALNDSGNATSAAQKPPPVEVRTQVIRHTVRIHRKPKPIRPPVRPVTPAPAPAPPRVVAAPPPQPVVAARPVAPVRTHAPIRTRTSGSSGHGGEHEHESEREGGDD